MKTSLSCNSLMTDSIHIGNKSLQTSTILQYPLTQQFGTDSSSEATPISVDNVVARLDSENFVGTKATATITVDSGAVPGDLEDETFQLKNAANPQGTRTYKFELDSGSTSGTALAGNTNTYLINLASGQKAAATLTLQTAELATLNAKEITITDAASTEKTYKLQNGGAGTTGDFVEVSKVRVVLTSGMTNVQIAKEIQKAIVHSNGHHTTITVAVDDTSGVITLTQATVGLVGNTAIVLSPEGIDFSTILVAPNFSGGLDASSPSEIATQIKNAINDGHPDLGITADITASASSRQISLVQDQTGAQGNGAIATTIATTIGADIVFTAFSGGSKILKRNNHKLVAGKHMGQILICQHASGSSDVIIKADSSITHIGKELTSTAVGSTLIFCWDGTKWVLLSMIGFTAETS